MTTSTLAHPQLGSKFPALTRFLVNIIFPKWIETAKGFDLPTLVESLTLQRERLIMGDIDATEARKSIDSAIASIHEELAARILDAHEDDDEDEDAGLC